MSSLSSSRGQHLLDGGRRFADGSGWLSLLAAPGFRAVLERIDRGLEKGRIDVCLPDGSRRTLGARSDGPVAEVDLRSWRALLRLVIGGSVGWYRAWEVGEWSSPNPLPLFVLFTLNRAALGETGRSGRASRFVNRTLGWVWRNSRLGSRRNIAAHYDLGNDFYAAWLDSTLTYSSAVWGEGDDLEAAQRRKIDMLLDRLALSAGETLLEVGCGWGSLAEAAANRGFSVTGITLSEEQRRFASERLEGGGAQIDLIDYRDVTGLYDAVVSVEMVEAIGEGNWSDYLTTVSRLLKPGGRAALQFISIDDAIYDSYASSPDFIQTYVFPGGMLISEARFRRIAEAAGLVWTDRQGFAADYARTLKVWRERFDQAVRAGSLPPGFGNDFISLWRYYLMYCEGGFRGGAIDVAQVTLEKPL